MAELIRAQHEVFGVQEVPDNDWYRDNGWTPVAEGTPITSEQQNLYDPSAHTATDVVAYLKTVDAAEQQRVIDAEKAGQNRATIVNYSTSSSTTAAPAATEPTA